MLNAQKNRTAVTCRMAKVTRHHGLDDDEINAMTALHAAPTRAMALLQTEILTGCYGKRTPAGSSNDV